MCRGCLRSSFDLGAIAAQRAARTDVARAAAAPATDLEDAATDATTAACPALTCPVLLEGGADMLLLVRQPDAPLLSLLDARGANECIDNPLNALRHPALVAAIVAHLDCHVSLAAYKAAAAAGAPMVVSPLTRARLCGGLALGPHQAHAAASDWTLAQLLAGGKLLGNINLWFAVVWFIVHGDVTATDALGESEGEVADAAAALACPPVSPRPGYVRLLPVERLEPLQPLLDEHLRWRMAHRSTSASLSGLSQFLCTRVPLGAACWYALHACLLNPDPQADPVRLHLPHAARLEALLRMACLPVDPRVRPHLARLAGLLALLRAVKAPHAPDECAAAEVVRLRVAALRQRALQLPREAMSSSVRLREHPPPLVLLDGVAPPEQVAAVRAALPRSLRGLSVPEITGLAALVAPGLSAADIRLPWDWTPPPLPLPASPDWPHHSALSPEAVAAMVQRPVPVCPATARPYSRVSVPAVAAEAAVDGGAAPTVGWRVASEAAWGPLDQQLCTTRMYGTFVQTYGAYPTPDELVAYAWSRAVVHGQRGKRTLPCTLEAIVAGEVASHAPLTRTIPAAEFSRRWLASVQLEARRRVEDAHAVSAPAEAAVPPVVEVPVASGSVMDPALAMGESSSVR